MSESFKKLPSRSQAPAWERSCPPSSAWHIPNGAEPHCRSEAELRNQRGSQAGAWEPEQTRTKVAHNHYG
jgi:hypothetical protein